MNSSGIKRGLAVSAVSALAVAGIPALANTASAAVGDSFTVVSSGPALNGGTEGAVVTIRFEDGEITPALIKAVGTTGTTTGSEDTADQSVEVVDASAPYNDPSNSNYDFIDVRVAVTTTNTGDTATFRLFEDDAPTNNTLDAAEARQTVSVSTAGALASIDIAPMSQSTPQNIESGAYTVTLKDSAGRTTQLAPGTSITVNDEAPVEATGVAADDAIDSQEIAEGVQTFTADPGAAAVGEYDITLTQDAVTKTATLVVTKSATLTADEIDIVTAADNWNGFGDGIDGGTTLVRVDQNTIRIDINGGASDANGHVLLAVDGNGVTFAGQDKASYTTTLDANGDGSILITADAATIQEGDTFVLSANGFDQTIEFDRAQAASIDGESATYFCQDDAACTVTAVVLDQFGNPVTTGEVEARRLGPQNVDTAPQRKQVGADGTVDFTFTDKNPIDGGTDTVQFQYFVDSFDNTADLSDSSTTIKYSATGQGEDYVISLDGNDTEATGYKASDAAIIPLTDAVADETTNPEDEDATIAITGGEPNQAVTLSVDNGARILAPGEDQLNEGSSSVETTLDGAGGLPVGYRVIGTKSGLVTLTVDSAGRTETAPLVVEAQDDPSTARNVTVSGPASVPHGTSDFTDTVVVTDAFGNPVSGVRMWELNVQVAGPGELKDSDVQTDANGQLNVNIAVQPGATGDITVKVTGIPETQWDMNQFGAAADQVYPNDPAKSGPGLPASSNVGTATTTVEAAPVPPEKVNAALTLRGGDNGAADDSLLANAINKTEGAKVKLFRKRADGTWKWLQTGVMNSKGNYRFDDVKDFNGDKVTRYKAIVKATALTNRGVGKKKVR